jgi:hypothetical protein
MTKLINITSHITAGFGLRKLLFLIAFIGAVGVGSIAARSHQGFLITDVQSQITDLTGPSFLGHSFFQVRVQQRVIVRVPRYRVSNASVNGMGKSVSKPVTYKEEKLGKCLIMDRFVASRPGPGPKESLELVTRDGIFVRAYLGDGCLAREFYAGAYMERPADGKLCADRDLLYARTGAKCEIDKFRVLVAK